MGARPGRRPAVVQKISRDLARVVTAPDVRERLATLGAEPMSMAPEEFARFVRAEIEDAARIARAAGIRLQ
jgi:tripartite-type tricarboxylate transporter receptor subunit TctC